MLLNGIEILLVELSLFWFSSYALATVFPSLQNIETVTYYWLMFTILTGIWEFSYIKNMKKVRRVGMKLLSKKKHIWNNLYNLKTLIPTKFAIQYYAEYGAYADREYYYLRDYKSLIIDSSSSVQSGFYSLLGLLFYLFDSYSCALAFISLSISLQFVSNFIYLSEYYCQLYDSLSYNFNTTRFPCGKFLTKRPMMLINFLSLIVPSYIIGLFVI